MIPEKWDSVFLYASVIDRLGNFQTGELFFYYTPKGLLKRKPINVYEIPNRFNIDEDEYSRMVDILYNSIKELREEFKKTNQKLWSNITISIKNNKFRITYNYDDIQNSKYTNYERHVIWRYKYINNDFETLNRDEKRIIQEYEKNRNIVSKDEMFETGIYIKNINNIVDYETAGYESIQNAEYVLSKNDETTTNQILLNKK